MRALLILWLLLAASVGRADVYVIGDVTEYSMRVAVEAYLQDVLDGKREVVVHIDSNGGRLDPVRHFLAVADMYRQRHGVRLLCGVEGKAWSAAFWLFAHCDRRITKKSASFLWHRIQFVLDDSYLPEELEEMAIELRRDQAVCNEQIERQMKASLLGLLTSYIKDEPVSAEKLDRVAPGFMEIKP